MNDQSQIKSSDNHSKSLSKLEDQSAQKSHTHKKKSKKPSFLKKVTKFLSLSITLFGASVPVWAALGGVTSIVGLIALLINSGSVTDPNELYRLNYMRLLLEDETLLCSNEEYSTQYAAPHLMRVEVALTQESIDKKREELERQLELAQKSYDDANMLLWDNSISDYVASSNAEKYKKLIYQYENELGVLENMEPAEEDDIRWVYPKQTTAIGKEQKRIHDKYYVPYFNEQDTPMKRTLDVGEEDNIYTLLSARQTLITLSDESYQKLHAKLLEDPDTAMQGISNLTCLEWLPIPDNLPEVNISYLKNLKNLRVLESPETRLKTKKYSNSNSILKSLSSLKILDVRGGLDYNCHTIGTRVYDENKLYYQNGLSNWSCAPDKDNPGTYYNKQDRSVWQEEGEIYYNHCGSDLSGLNGLSNLRMLYFTNPDKDGLDGLMKNKSIEFLSFSSDSPIDFGYEDKTETQQDENKEEPKEDGDEVDSDVSYEEFLNQLEYLNASGNILAAPFGHLENLKELYLQTDEYGVNTTTINLLKQLEILDISVRASDEFCKTLDNYLPDTDISCNVKKTKQAKILEDQDKPVHKRNFNLLSYPYPDVTHEEHRIYKYEDEYANGEIKTRGIDVVYKYTGGEENGDGNDGNFPGFGGGSSGGSGASGSWGEENEDNNVSNEGENENSAETNDKNYERKITFSWNAWGDWAYVTSFYQNMQRYLRNNYNEKLELFRYFTGYYEYEDGEQVLDEYGDPVPIVDYQPMSKYAFEEKLNSYTPPEFKGSLEVTVCEPEEIDKAMWSADYMYNEYKLNPDYYDDKPYSLSDVFTGEVEEDRSWSKTTFRNDTIVKQLGLTKEQYEISHDIPFEYWEEYVDDASGWFGQMFTTGRPGRDQGVFDPSGGLFRGSASLVDLSGTGWPEESETEGVIDEEPVKEDDNEEDEYYRPILKTPADETEISMNANIKFSWQPSIETPDKPVKYYWHVTIDGEEPPQIEEWFGLDVGNSTTFTYTNDTFSDPLPGGVWVWRVAALYSNGKIYWSDDRVIIRTWVMP